VEVEAAASRRLYARSGADRWQVSAERLHLAVERSLDHRFSGAATEADAAVYLASLHADDLALACACIDGHDGAWEHFIRELRPLLQRSERPHISRARRSACAAPRTAAPSPTP